MRLRWLARQFARPRGVAGRLLVGPWLDRIGAAMNRLALDRLEVGRGDVVLEVGFGGGDLLARLLRATDETVIGIDLSEAMVARARRRFRREPRLRLLHGSVEALPLEDASVDRACSVNSLYFWPVPQVAMRELARVLKPGGRLALCFEPPEELRKWPGHRFGFKMHDESAIRSMMEAAGLVGVRTAEGRGRMPDRFLCLTAEREGAEAGP